jgi:hypothetical protein
VTAKRKGTIQKHPAKSGSKQRISKAAVNGPAEPTRAEQRSAEAAEFSRPSTLRGILPTPPEVIRAVDFVLADRPASPEYRQMLTDEHKLRYYFGGHWIAYRNTPQGKEVLAVGLEEMARLRKRMRRAERETVVWAAIDLWHDLEPTESP